LCNCFVRTEVTSSVPSCLSSDGNFAECAGCVLGYRASPSRALPVAAIAAAE
jgi:hypothetical protein